MVPVARRMSAAARTPLPTGWMRNSTLRRVSLNAGSVMMAADRRETLVCSISPSRNCQVPAARRKLSDRAGERTGCTVVGAACSIPQQISRMARGVQ